MKKAIRLTVLTVLIILLALPAGSVSVGDAVRIGDVDGDGEVTAKDANHITRYLAHFESLDAAQLSRADFNGDGVVTDYDATLILSVLVTPDELPKTTCEFSMIVTADMKGEAWGSVSEDQTDRCSALNLVSLVNLLRGKESNLLLVDAGGSLFGSAISDDYTLFTSKRVGPMTQIFLSLQYDAVLLGTEAVSYQSQMVRNEMDLLTLQGTKVLGANLTKVYPNVNDPEPALWNEILPYCILEVPQTDETVCRVGLIGIVEPGLADAYDEVQISDPIASIEACKTELKGNCDVCLLLYYGSIENDESQGHMDSLRKLLRQINGIDAVLVSHSHGGSIRSEHDSRGKNVPIIALSNGAESATKVSFARRENGSLVYGVQSFDLKDFEPDEALQKQIKPYVNAMSEMMDARIGTLSEPIESFTHDTLRTTDGMELIHEMQIWGANQWIQNNDTDLPPTVLSIAYPYLGTTGWDAGAVRYRDVCARQATIPKYTLMLVRGSELRAWLASYTDRIMSDDRVYSLYGLSYLLNTMNPETPLGYLEYSSGLAVEAEEVFTLILAEDPQEDMILRPYLDETWMTYEDRVVEGFYMPSPQYTVTSDAYHNVDTVVAFFESIGEFSLKHETGWFVI